MKKDKENKKREGIRSHIEKDDKIPRIGRTTMWKYIGPSEEKIPKIRRKTMDLEEDQNNTSKE